MECAKRNNNNLKIILKKPIAPNKLMAFPWEMIEPDDIVAKITQYADIFAKLTPPAEA